MKKLVDFIKLENWVKQKLLSTPLTRKAINIPALANHGLKLMKVSFDRPAAECDYAPCLYVSGYNAASCISLDFDHPSNRPRRRRLNHYGALAVLELAEQYSIPLTWAICGDTALKDREAYRLIHHSTLGHDIGVHTYRHVDMSDSQYTEQDIVDEVSKCVEVIDTTPRPSTFVFPYNRKGHFETLKQLGFISYRSASRRIGYPQKVQGLWRIPSFYQLREESAGLSSLINRILDFTVEQRCTFHLWSHPWNLSINGDVEAYVESTLKPIFKHMYEKRREGRLWTCTMRELANYCEARECCSVITHREKEHVKIQVRCSISDSRFDFPPQITLRIPKNGKEPTIRVEEKIVPCQETRTSKYDSHLFLPLQFEQPERHVELTY